MIDDRLYSALRWQAWNRVIGEARGITDLFVSPSPSSLTLLKENAEKRDKFTDALDRFINEVEDNGWLD